MPEKTKVLYFAHPINAYNTPNRPFPLELELLEVIATVFSDWKIENPNQEYHQAGWKRYVEAGVESPMNYFYNEVLPGCDGVISLPFRDGMYGVGVFGETENLMSRGCPAWRITHEGIISRLSVLDPDLKLSIPETIERVFVDGNIGSGELAPY